MKIKKKELAVIIARFQVPELHAGHTKLLEEGFAHGEHVLILLGLSKTGKITDDDPLDFKTRKILLEFELAKNLANVTIMPIKGKSNNRVWSESVDAIISNFDTNSVVLLGGKDSFIPHYSGKYRAEEIDYVDVSGGGTTIRENIGHRIPYSDSLATKHFAHGAIWSQENRYPVNIPVVDIMVFQDEKEEQILLGRKAGETVWRFAGGYLDIEDKSYAHAAARELGEEMGLFPGIPNMEFVTTVGIDDWRYSKSKDRMISTVFKCYAHPGGLSGARPGDDLEELMLFNVSVDGGSTIVEGENGNTAMLSDHWEILNKYIINKNHHKQYEKHPTSN